MWDYSVLGGALGCISKEQDMIRNLCIEVYLQWASSVKFDVKCERSVAGRTT